jgi:predicted transcriptional regulator of viral defense system
MKTSKYNASFQQLLKKALFKASEANDLGIPTRMLSHFCSQGSIERVSRGIYRSVAFDTGLDMTIEDLILTASSISNGVVCLISALCLYELTDQIMREYWIAIPNADKSPVRPHARIIRMRNILLGQTTLKIGDYEIKIFDRERTVVDAFRFLSDEIAIKALQAYLKFSPSHKPDILKLSQYAKTLRVNLTPYIMALTT